MELMLRKIGGTSSRASKVIELTVKNNNGNITEDVTNLFSYVDERLIENLREIANELEEHNKELTEQLKTN